MHAKFLYALAAPAIASAAAVPQNDPVNWNDNGNDIVGGVAASAGDAPFIVSLQTSSGSHFCGGTLVNANTVLTAAHCSVGQTASAVRIRAGSLQKSSGGVVASVSAIRVHPSYDADTYNFDVAIWKLSSSVAATNGISYASLAASGSDPAAGTTLTVAGWGTTTSGGSSPAALRKVDVPVVDRTTCNSDYGSGSITANMFCAGLTAGGKDSCQGDSGGPIYTSDKVVVGAVSWGQGCAIAGKPGVYANIGPLQTWISQQL